MSFSIRYAIPMHGPGCARSVTEKLQSLGIDSVDIDLANQEAVVVSSVPPSQVVDSMQEIGRDAFVRGSGLPESAAVAVLETNRGKVGGLARLIQISKNTTLFDITLDKDYAPGQVSMFSYGDLSDAPRTLGDKLFDVTKVPHATKQSSHSWATIDGTPLANMIGRSLHTSSNLSGIIARSAGLWENDKSVCTCSGKTLWEERKDFRGHTNGNL